MIGDRPDAILPLAMAPSAHISVIQIAIYVFVSFGIFQDGQSIVVLFICCSTPLLENLLQVDRRFNVIG